MSDQNESKDLNPEGEVTVYCNHADGGVPVPAFVVTVITLIVACGIGLGWGVHSNSNESNACKVSNESVMAQAASNKAQFDMNTVTQKHIQSVQIAIGDDCVKRGGTPAFIAGNVTCTITPENKK